MVFRCLALAAFLAAPAALAQPELTVDFITQEPGDLIGEWATDLHWTDAGDAIYFFSADARKNDPSDSLFKVPFEGGEPVAVSGAERRRLPPRFTGWHDDRLRYEADFGRRVFARDGDVWLYDLGLGSLRRLTETREAESNPRFSLDGRRIVFNRGGNIYSLDLGLARVRQHTDIRDGNEPAEAAPSDQDALLERQQFDLFEVFRERARKDSLKEAAAEMEAAARNAPPTFYTGDKSVSQLRLSPDERFVTFALVKDEGTVTTRMIDYVTESGKAEDITARAKVGDPGYSYTFYVQDLERDTTYSVDLSTLPGAFDPADFQRERGETADSSRSLIPFGPYWSPDGRYAVLDVRTADNKDRWIARLDAEAGTVTSLNRQRDEAWVAGPGISWYGASPSDGGWIPESSTFWFQSEASGYSHLYTVDVATGEVQQLTDGDFEVYAPRLSQDGETWTFGSSEVSPYEWFLYRMPVEGGPRERLTTVRLQPNTYPSPGGEGYYGLSPDGEQLAFLHGAANHPPEVYAQDAEPGAEARRLTHSTTETWQTYPWREAEIVTFPASDGAEVPARIYRPENPNGAAVFFVHGAGYLHNTHSWWSTYFREYMFHNLLADRGYLVLDIDYRGSAGYGRDWRTAIYRHMGGRDLQDYVDASRWVGEEFDIDPERVAIYGGSYGGFITLMALFTEAEHFGAGAAFRSVTDWTHYNQPYTANILNTPVEDSLAFARSSPINFADGLEDPLLMTHGLIDDNVQPQDIFRLSQRLIELGKRNWELAIAPVEPHSYVEPTSWADKLHRVLELFERTVGPLRGAGETEG